MPGKKKSVTMQDVSEYSGYSLKTVSNVVNNWPYVSDEARQKVWDAIDAVGYRPNQMARSLVTGKTLSIGVVIPDIANPFFGLAIRGCEDFLIQSEYSVFLCNSNEDIDREKFYLNLLMSRAIDGLILWGSRLTKQELYEIIDVEISLVTVDFGEEPSRPDHTNIDVDSINGSITAVQYLIQQGYQKIAHLQGPKERITSERRLLGYKQALESAGISYTDRLVESERPSLRGGYRAACKLLESKDVSAIFCYNDLMAIGAMLAAKQFDRKIPDDLALVGFDNIALASIVDPPLTTMEIAQYELGRLTGETVLEQLEDNPEGQTTILFPVELHVRGSSEKWDRPKDQQSEIIENIISSLTTDFPYVEPGNKNKKS